MAKRKVIEDSDEEDDEPQAFPPPACAVPTNLDMDDIVNAEKPPCASRDLNTTDALTCDFQGTYKSLMESTPNSDRASTKPIGLPQQALPSPNSSRKGMKRALSNMEMTSPGGHKAARTKRSRPGRESWRYFGSSDGEIERNLKVAASNRKIDQPNRGFEDGNTGIMVAKDMVPFFNWTIGSTSVDITQAKAVPSSGPPASWNSNTGSVSGRTHYMNSSVPPTALSRATNENNGILPKDQTQVNLRSSAIAALQTLPSSDSKHELSSGASATSASNISTMKEANPKGRNTEGKYLEDELSLTPPMSHTRSTVNPIVLLPQKINEDAKSNRSTKTPQSIKVVSDELDSDDNAIGMPKEQYRPRLSRSRAGMDASELVVPVDFSKRPESITKTTVRAKSKTKTSKKKSLEEPPPPKYQTEDEADDDPMEETKKSAVPIWKDESPKPQLEADGGHKGADEIVTLEKEVVAQMDKTAQKPKKQRGRPRKANVTEGGEHSMKAAEGAKEGISSVPDSAVRPAVERMSETATAAELQAESADEEGERKGHCTSEDESDPKDNDRASDKVLEESAGNTSKQKASPSAKNKPPPETPKKSAKASDTKGPDKHSPLNSGKVAYRVGLSKRARIEPLLRIVRK